MQKVLTIPLEEVAQHFALNTRQDVKMIAPELLSGVLMAKLTAPGQQPPVAGASGAKVAPQEPDAQALIHEANQHYERALQLQRQGDWAGYGDEIKKLGEILNKLAAKQP